jgi:hypothetical protein
VLASKRLKWLQPPRHAWHPNPDELAAFLASWKGGPVAMNQLTSEDVHRCLQFISPEQPPTP